MFGVTASILLVLLQTVQTGTVIGSVQVPHGVKTTRSVRVMLLPPQYTEIWNKQLQTRLDNYWEVFKPQFIANKEHFLDFSRMAQVEAFRYIASNLRRDLGDDASRLMKDVSATGQFEFIGVPFGTYQLLVHATVDNRDFVWVKMVDLRVEIPIFVDLGKPVS